MNNQRMGKLLQWALAPAALCLALFFSLANSGAIQEHVLVTIRGTGLVFPATLVFGLASVASLFAALLCFEIGKRLRNGEDMNL